MMAKAVTVARRPDAVQPDADATCRRLFDSFNPDSGGQISPLEVLSRLERSGLRADDPRIAEALADPLDNVIAVRARAAHTGQRTDHGARLLVPAGRAAAQG